jgi:pyrroline-5-carboxylate reductase
MFGKLFKSRATLPVYVTARLNDRVNEITHLLQGVGTIHSIFSSQRETVLNIYGSSAAHMWLRLAGFMDTYPLCEQARVVQIT